MIARVDPRSVRYLVVGSVAFVVDFGVTWSLALVFPLLVANTFGFMIANLANFLLAHRWVFGAPFEKASMLAAYLAVLGVSLIGLVLNDLLVWLTVERIGMALIAGKVIAAIAGLVWNYAARIIWIYRHEAT